MQQKAQVMIEVLVISSISISVLFLGIMLYSLYNNTSNQIISQKISFIECNNLADSISEIYSLEGSAQKEIFLSTNAKVFRQEPNPGLITMGTITCNYFGNAKTTANFDTVGPEGFTLTPGKYILSKNSDINSILIKNA